MAATAVTVQRHNKEVLGLGWRRGRGAYRGCGHTAQHAERHGNDRAREQEWWKIGYTLQLAEHTGMQGGLESHQVAVVMYIAGAVFTVEGSIGLLHAIMAVQRDGQQHGHIDQQQQP